MLNGIIINLISSFICFFIGIAVANHKNLKLFFKSLFYINKDIRFSISYLYKIKIDNKYLLIEGNRIKQLQPVGGVYKIYNSFESLEKDFEIQFEKKPHFYEEGDLRFYVKGKNVNKVIKWFATMKNREISVYREFYEEIIENDILPNTTLNDIRIEFLKQVKTKMKYSRHFGVNEILIYDIFEIKLSEAQKKQILKIEKQNELIKLVSSNDIEKECVDVNGKSYKIGAHTKYIL